MSGTHARLGELDGIASKLRNGAADLDGSAAPPPAPQAGMATEAVAGVMAMLTMSAAGVVEGMNAIADEVSAGRNLYDTVDHANAGDIANTTPHSPR